MPFNPQLRQKLLLWCDRHCCLCKKQCGPLIDVHHIQQERDGGGSTEDNAIPLCFDCHGIVGHYNSHHPKGNRFSREELKRRRDQIYDEFTRHLVPSLDYKATQRGRKFPDVGLEVGYPGVGSPVQLNVLVRVYLGTSLVEETPSDPLYHGEVRWNLNPGLGMMGHFHLPGSVAKSQEHLALTIHITVWDVYERPHQLLPVSWVYDRQVGDWWFDPVGEEGVLARAKRFDGKQA